jgi:hypothetical protein
VILLGQQQQYLIAADPDVRTACHTKLWQLTPKTHDHIDEPSAPNFRVLVIGVDGVVDITGYMSPAKKMLH